jgi:hypothetical protein
MEQHAKTHTVPDGSGGSAGGLSVARPTAGGQWRHIWEIEHDAPVVEELPPPPPPTADPIEGLPQVRLLSVMQVGPGRLRLEIITPHHWLNGPEVGYVIRLLWMLEDLVGPLRIDGQEHHPILRAARLSRQAEAAAGGT